MKTTLFTAISVLAFASASMAQDLAEMPTGHSMAMPQEVGGPIPEASGFGINFGVSTLGTTIEPNYRLNDRFGFRAPIGRVALDGDYEDAETGDTYAGSLDGSGFGLLADFHTGLGGLRLSGGAFRTDYQAEGTMTATVGAQTGDITVQMSQKQAWAPAAVLGYDWTIGKHAVISADAGALFGKGFDLEGSSTTFSQADVDAEIAEAKATAGDLKMLPYLKLTIGFAF